MKTAKKALLLVLCGCLLVAASIIGTMAYFTDDDSVTNTFTVGKVEISLDEAAVDEYGNVEANANPARVENNEYKIIPGHTYVKDPTVTITTDSEDCYIRMKVEVAGYENLVKALPNNGDTAKYYGTDGVFLLQNLVKGWSNDVWKFEKFDVDKKTYEFRYANKVAVATADKNSDREGVQLEPLFTEIIVPGEDVTELNIADFANVTIKVTAQAIQADGFADKDGKTAEEIAWEAFDAQRSKY